MEIEVKVVGSVCVAKLTSIGKLWLCVISLASYRSLYILLTIYLQSLYIKEGVD